MLTKIKEYFKERECMFLTILFAGLLITANCVAAKQVPIGTWFGRSISITVGIICYPFSFLITDILGEKFGKKAAANAVVGGLLAQVAAIILIVIANAIGGSDTATDFSFNAILGSNWILTIGSLLACLLSQSWDVWVFHKIRDKYIEKHGTTAGGRWIWNNCSTISSQLIDSIVFYIALIIMLRTQGVVLGFADCVATVFAYWVIKVGIAILDTPFFYLFTGKSKKFEK